MRNHLVVLALLLSLGSGASASYINVWGEATQPDGTTFVYHAWGDEFGGNRETADGYVFVYGSDGWYYYAELDARGEYEASPYRVGIDDPAEIGIPKHLRTQRSAVRQAEIDAVRLAHGGFLRGEPGHYLTQPNGTAFLAYYGDSPADGYVIAIYLDYEEDSGFSVCVNCDTIPIDVRIGEPASDGSYYVINYGDGAPFYAFVYDDQSGWYYYAERDAQGDYRASPYRVGLDLPPGYAPPTAVQERSWGAVKHLFHK